MGRKSTISPRHVLHKLFPTARLQGLARETGAVVRQRKLKIDALFWTLVLGLGIGRVRIIADLRRAYEKSTGQRIEESPFYERFTPASSRCSSWHQPGLPTESRRRPCHRMSHQEPHDIITK